MDGAECVKILKALSDETRVKIFDTLRGGTLCACKILEKLNVTQPTLSHHLKTLCESGLVLSEKKWKWTYYTLNCAKLNELLTYLGDVKCNRGDNICR